jgi:hypothetical protein
MANLVTKSRSKKVLVMIAILFVLSIFSVFFFRLNLGVEFKDAQTLVIQLDHEESLANVYYTLSRFSNISKIEKEGTSKFYLYYQNYTPEELVNLEQNVRDNLPGVILADFYEYHTARERALLARAEIVSGFALIVYSIYFIANFKNKKILKKDVLNLLMSDLSIILICSVMLMGFVSVLGELNVIMNTNFMSMVLFAIGIIMLFRIYEIQKFKAIIKTNGYESIDDTNNKLINYYWPEFVFLSAFLFLIVYIPLTVFDGSIFKASIMLVLAIFLSILGVFYLKPALIKLFASFFEIKQIKKIKFINKQW